MLVFFFFFFSSRRRHTRFSRDWSSDVCSSDLVPQSRLEMALELGQVEVRSAAAREEFLRVVEDIKREVEDAAGNRRAVDPHVLFRQMPPAGANEERGELVAERVRLPF